MAASQPPLKRELSDIRKSQRNDDRRNRRSKGSMGSGSISSIFYCIWNSDVFRGCIFLPSYFSKLYRKNMNGRIRKIKPDVFEYPSLFTVRNFILPTIFLLSTRRTHAGRTFPGTKSIHANIFSHFSSPSSFSPKIGSGNAVRKKARDNTEARSPHKEKAQALQLQTKKEQLKTPKESSRKAGTKGPLPKAKKTPTKTQSVEQSIELA